jgi:thymidylate synthase ThyX
MRVKEQEVQILIPLSPEIQAYTLARFSRSPDLIEESLRWVRAHDEQSFLDHYYFQYGHSSIADLGSVALAYENVSELAAIEIVDHPLWNGQAKSTRYQDFSKCEPVVPPGLNNEEEEIYLYTAQLLLDNYFLLSEKVRGDLRIKNPKPESMKDDAYERALSARAFDAARYLLFLGIPTNVGQTTSVRTLEEQGTMLLSSAYPELQNMGERLKLKLKDKVPTLARYLRVDPYRSKEQERYNILTAGMKEESPVVSKTGVSLFLGTVDILNTVIATWIFKNNEHFDYSSARRLASSMGRAQGGFIKSILTYKPDRSPLLTYFKDAPYTFEITMDIGAYRDLHRHRNCVQFRQPYTWLHGWEIPDEVKNAGFECIRIYENAMKIARIAYDKLPLYARDYIIPFGVKTRVLFKMDLWQAQYMIKLRSGGQGAYQLQENRMEDERSVTGNIPGTRTVVGRYCTVDN